LNHNKINRYDIDLTKNISLFSRHKIIRATRCAGRTDARGFHWTSSGLEVGSIFGRHTCNCKGRMTELAVLNEKDLQTIEVPKWANLPLLSAFLGIHPTSIHPRSS